MVHVVDLGPSRGADRSIAILLAGGASDAPRGGRAPDPRVLRDHAPSRGTDRNDVVRGAHARGWRMHDPGVTTVPRFSQAAVARVLETIVISGKDVIGWVVG